MIPIRVVYSVVTLIACCNLSRAAGVIEWGSLSWRDTHGESVVLPVQDWKVVCFLGTECPLAKLYAPRLQQLADDFSERDVTFVGVNSNPQDSPAEIDAYAKKLDIQFKIVKDSDQQIANTFHATRTPEVFVLDPRGIVQYQGRIDDQYEPGIARPAPTREHLREALTQLLDGDSLESASLPSVGCLITRIPAKQKIEGASAVTFHRDVVPILNQHCVECHRKGAIGPFELTQYDEVVGWGQMILEVVEQHRMPPWHADPAIGSFVGERRMTNADRELLARWLDQGMPEGDLDDQPTSPQWPDGWQWSDQPHEVFAMHSKPFVVPKDGTVDYQYFVVDPHWTEDRWIRAAQVIPGAPSVVHHAIVFLRPPDGSDSPGIGWMGAYVPGQRAVMLPPGHARRIPAGSKLVFQMHYTPSGTPTPDLTRVGVWFADTRTVTQAVYTNVAINHDFEIPPNTNDYQVHLELAGFPQDSKILGMTPHMHLRGKSFELIGRLWDGKSQPLLRVPKYDFNWQHWYEFETPIDLNSIESLQMTVTFDNSVGNPTNPAPNDYVAWGDQTWEEMAVAFFDISVPKGAAKRSYRPSPKQDQTQASARQTRIDQRVKEFLAAMDRDQDGVVQKSETPVSFQRYGFQSMDTNRDSQLTESEIEAAAALRK